MKYLGYVWVSLLVFCIAYNLVEITAKVSALMNWKVIP